MQWGSKVSVSEAIAIPARSYTNGCKDQQAIQIRRFAEGWDAEQRSSAGPSREHSGRRKGDPKKKTGAAWPT